MGVEETLPWLWAGMVDEFTNAQDPRAYIMNARAELEALRSDIVNELGNSSGDCYLKAAFTAYINAADLNLQRALR